MFKQPDKSIFIGKIWTITEVTKYDWNTNQGFPLRNTEFLTLCSFYVHVILLEVFIYKIFSFPVRITNDDEVCSEIVLTSLFYCLFNYQMCSLSHISRTPNVKADFLILWCSIFQTLLTTVQSPWFRSQYVICMQYGLKPQDILFSVP